MIYQSFDTTRHYREENNMVIERRDCALLVKLFYPNCSKSSTALRKYRRMKGHKRTHVNKWVILVWRLGEVGDPSLPKLPWIKNWIRNCDQRQLH